MTKSLSWLKKTLDVVLLEKGRIHEEQLNDIRRVRAAEGGGWASHFVDAGLVTENELMQLILADTGLPYFPLLNLKPQQELLDDFTRDFLITFECFPIDQLGPICTIATPNPYQKDLVLSRQSHVQDVELYVCRVSEWRECIQRLDELLASTVGEEV
jgi:hypothetical protein